jgi:hypothetical protein
MNYDMNYHMNYDMKNYRKYFKYFQKAGNLSCILNKYNNVTYIYHLFSDKPYNYPTGDNVNIIFSSISMNEISNNSLDELNNLFIEIFKNCMIANILIYIDFNNTDIINKINRSLSFLINNDMIVRLQNVTIINKISSIFRILYNFKKNNVNVFKKVINIFPIGGSIEICEETNFLSSIQFNTTLTTIINVNSFYGNCSIQKISYSIKKTEETNDEFTLFGGRILSESEREILYRFMDVADLTNNLNESWWFKWYFGVPLCAYGRLLQSTGTCWCNAIINALTLTPIISEMMIDKWNKLNFKKKEKILLKYKTFDDFNGSTDSLKNLFMAMINLLLINKTKAMTDNGNFIAEFAARIKSKSLHKDENYYITHGGLNYGDGHSAYNGLTLVLSEIFDINIDYVLIESFGNYSFNSSYNELNKKKKPVVDNFNKLVPIYNLNNNDQIRKQLDELNNIINELQEQINKIDKINDNVKSFLTQLSTAQTDITFDLTDLTINTTFIKMPKFVFIPVKNMDIVSEKITLNDVIYTLHASIIRLSNYLTDDKTSATNIFDTSGHAIVGLKCNDKYYIYDSNNYISYDNWQKGEYVEYLKILSDKGVNYKYINVDVLIYILE